MWIAIFAICTDKSIYLLGEYRNGKDDPWTNSTHPLYLVSLLFKKKNGQSRERKWFSKPLNDLAEFVAKCAQKTSRILCTVKFQFYEPTYVWISESQYPLTYTYAPAIYNRTSVEQHTHLCNSASLKCINILFDYPLGQFIHIRNAKSKKKMFLLIFEKHPESNWSHIIQ